MTLDKFKVTCLKCEEADTITVLNDGMNPKVSDYERKFNTPFMSFRFRGDGKWGFLCKCGNDNRLAPSEADNFDNLVKGDEESLRKITASLLIPDDKQFEMRTA